MKKLGNEFHVVTLHVVMRHHSLPMRRLTPLARAGQLRDCTNTGIRAGVWKKSRIGARLPR